MRYNNGKGQEKSNGKRKVDGMINLADRIERHLKALLEESPAGIIEVQRNELASYFGCVPSQINYVLSTRFTPQQGYIVESRRGGGGFVRVIKLPFEMPANIKLLLEETIGEEISQTTAERLIARLQQEALMTSREALLLRRVVDRNTLKLAMTERDRVRARILKAALVVLWELRGESG